MGPPCVSLVFFISSCCTHLIVSHDVFVFYYVFILCTFACFTFSPNLFHNACSYTFVCFLLLLATCPCLASSSTTSPMGGPPPPPPPPSPLPSIPTPSPHFPFTLLLWGGWWVRVVSRRRSFGGGTARAQCVLLRVPRALLQGRHSAHSMRATSVTEGVLSGAAQCAINACYLSGSLRREIKFPGARAERRLCGSPRLWVPGRFRDRSLPRNDPCAVLLGRVGRGESAHPTHT